MTPRTMLHRVCSSFLVCLALAAPTLASEVRFSPFDDCAARALELLAGAQSTVDIAHYNIRNEAFFDALQALRARGVRVRIVVDAKNARQPWNTLDDRFEAAGFDIRRYENTRSAYAIMHHKFTVIDGRTLLTGSYNWNETAQLVNDEAMLVLDDPGLVAAYEREFAELWGDAPEAAGVGQGASGEARFSPEDQPDRAIVAAIAGAQRRVLVAVFAFKDRDVSRALAAAAGRGVEVVLVTERKQADTTNADETVAAGGGRVIVGANTSSAHSAMHHKFAVIDDETVIAGACNWTYTAFRQSNEDVLLLRDRALAARFTALFGALVRRYDPAGFDPAAFGISAGDAAAHLVVTMPDTRPGDRVVVTGDVPDLGSWDPHAGLPLETTDGIFPTWTARLRLPAGLRARWKAVVIGPAGEVRWELGADRALETDPAGTDGVWMASFRYLVDVDLAVTVALPAGAEARLVGADPALGGWDPQRGWPLAVLDPARPDRAAARVPLPGRASIPCKVVILTAAGDVEWESGADRVLTVHDADGPQAMDLGDFRQP